MEIDSLRSLSGDLVGLTVSYPTPLHSVDYIPKEREGREVHAAGVARCIYSSGDLLSDLHGEMRRSCCLRDVGRVVASTFDCILSGH